MTANATADERNLQTRKRARRVPGTTNLFMFSNRIDEDTLKHYYRVRPIIEGLLIDELTASGFDAGTVSTRLVVIGKTEEEATPRLIVFCELDAESIVRTLLTSEHVTPYLRPREQSVPRLEPHIVPRGPNLTSACLDISICCNNIFADEHTTYCGAPVMLTSGCRGLYQKRKRQATFGGVIRVDRGNGETDLYGMTAGHVVEELLMQERLQDSDGQLPWEMHGWMCEHNIMGNVLDQNMLPGVAAGQAQPSHDWALFNVTTPRPNTVVPMASQHRGVSDYVAAHQILVAKRPKFEDETSDPVLLLSSIHGTQRGELTNHHARIWIGQSKIFVNAYMLELEEGHGRSNSSICTQSYH
jgi:hypothetical protein